MRIFPECENVQTILNNIAALNQTSRFCAATVKLDHLRSKSGWMNFKVLINQLTPPFFESHSLQLTTLSLKLGVLYSFWK